MKRWGFLTGALLAAIGVWAFYALTGVSDDDRLASVLTDHCVPYVQTGDAPFSDMGRTPGVFDDVPLRDAVSDGGARLIYDGRFSAQWGTIDGVGRASRICEISPIYTERRTPAFEVRADGFTARYADLLGLVAEQNTAPNIAGWYEDPTQQDRGLRVVMIAGDGIVSNVVVMDDLPDE
ncbi:hypothetical protein [Pseudooctadecabacter sp.]|uniref:hypothetical protein n=1 Tax=Pseudooctadecabacter sp. TaxID=1966338 RepID=UPI0035C8551D